MPVPFYSCLQIFPSIRVFSSESVLCMRWPKYWSFSFSIRPSNEHSGLISFRMDWFDLFAAQGTLKSLQHHSSKASILWCSAFFIVQLISIHDYWKTIPLTRKIFAGKVMSLLFNTLSRFVITFLPKNNCLLISWLQSTSAVFCTMEYYLSIKKNKLWICIATWMNFKCIMVSLKSQIQSPNMVWFYQDRTDQLCDWLELWKGVDHKGHKCVIWSSFVSGFWWWLHDCTHLSKLIKLLTQRGGFHCINEYISIIPD